MRVANIYDGETAAFIQDVRDRAHLEEYVDAYRLTQATLDTLSAAISAGQARQLAAWLPEDLGQRLHAQAGDAAAMSRKMFVQHVSSRIDEPDEDSAASQVAGVFHALAAIAPADELGDTDAQLPNTIAAFFE